MAPIVQTHNITVFLNEAGRAEITPAAINNGTTDNCGALNYSLDITSFSCKDIGQNQVKLTAIDASGNSASAPAIVTVTGTCDEEPPPPGGVDPMKFLYILILLPGLLPFPLPLA
ncbi:hypothetical protein LZ575_21795 [Antarcticibacterium sp. 1MA-6-2]|uniref:hypothetical protein n=1 Tax=Antarcticibacterium sp. 1MA-6-2 TaxID=2908210 RepID=UPI001F393B45|nr:hypothetical protein [Antarcticibacterium sp. 1MA-6-2]UJH91197.1 hypothetical protein LZ575_21795 [Antarcticibacterium sp. 1MA-6-2]